nr:hypothetical protein [uncultured bacterium]
MRLLVIFVCSPPRICDNKKGGKPGERNGSLLKLFQPLFNNELLRLLVIFRVLATPNFGNKKGGKPEERNGSLLKFISTFIQQ